MIWARTDILGGTWASRTRPGTAREALARTILFFFSRIKTENGFFLFSEGVGYPPAQQEKAGHFFYSEGVRSKIGISGFARANWPVPGLVPLKYFPPLEAATAADLA